MKLFRVFALFFLYFISPCHLWTEIRTIHRIEEIRGQIPQGSLVFIDLGYTVQYPAEPMLARYEARPFFLNQTAQMEDSVFKRLSTLLLAQTKWALVEEEMKSFFDSLQEQGIAMVGMTGEGRIPYIGQLPYEPNFLPSELQRGESVEGYYLEELRALGIHFSESAPQSASLEKSLAEHNCIYRKGVLFLCHQSMGDIIPLFFQAIPHTWRKIIAIDDEIFYLRHLEQVLAQQHIPFEGFYYVRYPDMPKTYDPSLVEVELRYLIEKEKVLSDEEAKKLPKQQ